MSETKLFAVAGDPVLNSLSPEIFNRLFRATGMNAIYFRLAAQDAREVIDAVAAMGLDGVNITSPFKEAVLPYLQGIDDPGRAIGAINGLVSRSGRLVGFNTDYKGVIGALRARGVSLEGSAAVVFGAGGAARAAAYGLLHAGSAKVTLINRTVERARNAARRLGCAYRSLEAAAVPLRDCNICVHCLPPGRGPTEAGIRVGLGVFLDAGYRRFASPRQGRDEGARSIGGRDWLLHQAFPAFRIFTGREVPAALRNRGAWGRLDCPSVPKPNIALVGFSGAGKTTIGRKLSNALGYAFADTDALVEARSGMPVVEIFRRRGRSDFREIEKAVIHDAIPGARRTVFAVGGGALGCADNRAIVKRHCLVVWIWVSLRVSLERVKPGSRPMLDRAAGDDFAERLFAARIPSYARTSDMALIGESKRAAEIAKRIHDEIDQAFGN